METLSVPKFHCGTIAATIQSGPPGGTSRINVGDSSVIIPRCFIQICLAAKEKAESMLPLNLELSYCK